MNAQLTTTEDFVELYESNLSYRYMVYYGGRAGRKSWEIARSLIGFSMKHSNSLILCAREIQNSISDSVLRLLSNQIELLGLNYAFDIQRTTIIGLNGSEFVFKGLNGMTIDSLKSFEGADVCWVEESHSVSERSWSILIPTIRKSGSKIIISFNPDLVTDPVYQRFILNTPPKTLVRKVDYLKNFDCSQETIDEAEYLKRIDYESYAHIWLGEVRAHSDAQIFKGKYIVSSFDVDDSFGDPLFGADWGFSQDPNTLIKVYIKDDRLYIRNELYKIGCEIKDTPAMWDKMPQVRSFMVRADRARPELVNYMKGEHFKIESVSNWKGSVEDGISFIRSFEQVVIHADCKHTAEEFRLYSYKTDKRTGDILPDIIDKNNHCIDGIRYALAPLTKVKPQYKPAKWNF